MNRSKNLKYRWRGIRIGKRDDRLVLGSVILFTLFAIFAASFIIYGDKILAGNGLEVTEQEVYTGILTGGFLSVAILYLCYRVTGFEKLIARQRLAKMIIENGWFESETISGRNHYKKITYFPAIYYRRKGRKLYITVKISMGKYQDKLLHLEEKLETGLACELVEKDMRGVYICYTFLQDVEENRISVEDLRAEKGNIQLMKHIGWKYDSMPHMLIAGVTGGGKTCFLMGLIEVFLREKAQLYIVDPKDMDLAYLAKVLPEVYCEKDEILACIKRFYENMVQRTKEMKQMPEYRMGMNYADLGFRPCFLIFDEYVAFMDMLGKKEWEEPMSLVRKIVMLGRQAGFFLILACQRPDAKYLGDGIRDQFGIRAALGDMSDSGYDMMFGKNDKIYQKKKIPGRGYINTGNAVITEFYTPFVPRGHDFFLEIKTMCEQMNNENVVDLQKEHVRKGMEQDREKEESEKAGRKDGEN